MPDPLEPIVTDIETETAPDDDNDAESFPPPEDTSE